MSEADQGQVADIVINTPFIRDQLAKRYCAPEWAYMEEVAPRTGGGTRYADAVAVNLWSSRGHAVHGFEIKVSRSDWLRELKQPSKAEDIYQYCNGWWLVAPKGVVKDGELPPSWGLLEARESGLVQKVAAPRLEPKPIGRAFFASLMRRGHESIERMAERKVREALNQVTTEVNKRVSEGVAYGTRRLKDLEKELEDFKSKTGIHIGHYCSTSPNTIKLAEQFERHLSGYGGEPYSRLIDLADSLERATAGIRQAIEEARKP